VIHSTARPSRRGRRLARSGNGDHHYDTNRDKNQKEADAEDDRDQPFADGVPGSIGGIPIRLVLGVPIRRFACRRWVEHRTLVEIDPTGTVAESHAAPRATGEVRLELPLGDHRTATATNPFVLRRSELWHLWRIATSDPISLKARLSGDIPRLTVDPANVSRLSCDSIALESRLSGDVSRLTRDPISLKAGLSGDIPRLTANAGLSADARLACDPTDVTRSATDTASDTRLSADTPGWLSSDPSSGPSADTGLELGLSGSQQ
jgi:hypothetical protein